MVQESSIILVITIGNKVLAIIEV